MMAASRNVEGARSLRPGWAEPSIHPATDRCCCGTKRPEVPASGRGDQWVEPSGQPCSGRKVTERHERLPSPSA
jgi:hypothetical protein